MKKRILTGTVSKITGIPKQTLIYYDKIGLLEPETYENGYRGYSYEDLEKLDIIMSLKETGLSLKEIIDFMKESSIDQSIDVLEKQSLKLKDHIEYLNTIQARIEFRVKELKVIKRKPLTKEIRIVTYPERYIVDFPIDNNGELSFGYALKAMRDHMFSNEAYHKYAHMVEGVMLDKQCLLSHKYEQLKSVFVFIDHYDNKPYEKILKKGKYVVMQHHGTYDTTHYTYATMLEYLRERSFTIVGDALELSVLNHWATQSEEDYVTEIQIPIQ